MFTTYLAPAAYGWIGAAILMGALWRVHLMVRNAGIVDVGWAALVAALAVSFAVSGDGYAVRRAAVGAIVGLWGVRLSWYLLMDRVIGRPEDGRYATLRATWGPRARARFFWFFQAQAMVAVFFALPALLASRNATPHLLPVEIGALVLWVLAFAGEVSADRQLARFKADPSHRGETCQAGWWRYSRHPNYFFEWVMWVAFALFALGSPWGVLALACPAAMLYLLFRVTGIPATEAQAIRTRGDDYRQYQRTTSAFVPWVPR